MAYLRECEREASAKVAPMASPQDTSTHQDELTAAHQSTTVPGAEPASGEGHGPWPRRPI
jgi:hypothetical protein